MNRQLTSWTLVVVFLLAAFGIVGGLAWRSKPPYATVVMQDDGKSTVIQTNAPEELLYAAVREATDPYRSYTGQLDGTKSDPTYRASSKVVRKGGGKDIRRGMTSETAIGNIEFCDRDGNLIRIETVQATGEPTLVKITYSESGDLPLLTRHIVRCLRGRGVNVE